MVAGRPGPKQIPRRRAQQGLGFAPAEARDAQKDAVALRVPPQQFDRVVRPVRREHIGTAARSGERRQPEAAAELEHTQPLQVAPRHVPRERQAARPELGPVGKELLLVERRLVDQLVGAGRTEDLEPQPAPELDLLLDEVQRAANRSTGLPSGSRSCA